MNHWRCPALMAAVLLSVTSIPLVHGHGELHERIAELSTQIDRAPGDATLYFRRAEMRRLHQEWTAAEDDYRHALTLNPKLAAVRLGRATLRFDCGHAAEAEKLATEYLLEVPGQADGLLLRARARATLGRVDEAARDYDAALASSIAVTADVYLERAMYLNQTVPARRDEALRGLDEGMQRVGPLLTLQEMAVELEVAAGRTDDALTRIESVLATHPRHVDWLATKWRVLVATGRTDDATAAKSAALAALDALPPRRRLLPVMVDLDRRLRANDPTPPRRSSER